MTLETLAIHLDLPLSPTWFSVFASLPAGQHASENRFGAVFSLSSSCCFFFFFSSIWNCLASLHLCLFCFPVHNTVFFFLLSSMSSTLLNYSSSPHRSSSLPFSLHPHFINPSLTSIFALVPPSTTLSTSHALSSPPPPSLHPLETELSINSRTM